MYKAIDIEDDLLCELRALPPGEDDELLSYKVGQAVQFYLRHREAAEQERLDHLHSLDGALAGAEGEDLAASVAARRAVSWT